MKMMTPKAWKNMWNRRTRTTEEIPHTPPTPFTQQPHTHAYTCVHTRMSTQRPYPDRLLEMRGNNAEPPHPACDSSIVNNTKVSAQHLNRNPQSMSGGDHPKTGLKGT